jgi:hypothetical protein
MNKSNFWPTHIETQNYMPVEFLMETVTSDLPLLREIDLNIYDVPIQKHGEYYQAEMTIEQDRYRVHFREREDHQDSYDITLRVDDSMPSISTTASIAKHMANFNQGTSSTSKGISLKVFSFVASSIISFSKTHEVTFFYLMANESKKSRAYELLTKNIAGKIGWTVEDGKSNAFYRACIINPKYI